MMGAGKAQELETAQSSLVDKDPKCTGKNLAHKISGAR